jgi:hypothetical protein
MSLNQNRHSLRKPDPFLQDSDSVAAETRMAGARPAMLPMALV